MDNPKKKKLDSKRIALSQKHERDYLMKISKKFLTFLSKEEGKYIVTSVPKPNYIEHYSVPSAKRIAKGLIKCLRSYRTPQRRKK